MQSQENTTLPPSSYLSTPAGKPRFAELHSVTLKMVIIGILTLLLLIPLGMVEGLIRERRQTESGAVTEIASKWGAEQVLAGPCLAIPYIEERLTDKNREPVRKTLLLLPDILNVKGEAQVEKRKRGIYEASVYRADILLSGTFNTSELDKSGIFSERLLWNEARVVLGLSDLKGIDERVSMEIGGKKLDAESGIPVENLSVGVVPGKDGYVPERETPDLSPDISSGIFASGLNVKLDMVQDTASAGEPITFSIPLSLKGSQGWFVIPAGKTTTVEFASDWGTPAFGGSFLPETRAVTADGFSAKWKVLDLNRSFGQVVAADNAVSIGQMASSAFGVKFVRPVDQYRQNVRSVKYAVLLILLTFAAVFFIELWQKKPVNPFQYLLVGLALVLFYALLLSMSEVWGFNSAYLVAALMTAALVTIHVWRLLKSRKYALWMGGLLVFLYGFVFVLLQMESYALLTGSLGLFVILAAIMYYSKKVRLE